LSSEANNDGSGIGQGHLRSDLGPATQGRTLEMKKEKHPAKEAFNATAFAQFFSRPSGRQARVLLAVLGIVGHDSYCPEHLMNPSNQAQAPISRIQTNNPRADVVKLESPCQQALREGSIMRIGRRKQEEERES
jgi:hypothetical protein